MDKLRVWQQHQDWPSAEHAWDAQAHLAASVQPNKLLAQLPRMPGITAQTQRGLKWKSLWYIIRHDHRSVIRRYLCKRPFHYAWHLLRSMLRAQSYLRDKDFFFYGICSEQEWEDHLQSNTSILLIGFSYCHKPFECPSGRFTDACIHDPHHPVCQQCFIGKCVHCLPKDNIEIVWIPTIHYIGEKVLQLRTAYPDKDIFFLITACELTLKMFGDWGNMANIRGIGIRLDGRICNTMRAFVLSEQGVKPGLTVVTSPTQQRILQLLRRTYHTPRANL